LFSTVEVDGRLKTLRKLSMAEPKALKMELSSSLTLIVAAALVCGEAIIIGSSMR